jgi:hypothetical protein
MYMEKHSLRVGTSVLNPAVGLALSCVKQMAKGSLLPMKGPLFDSMPEALKFCETLPAAKLHEKIMQVSAVSAGATTTKFQARCPPPPPPVFVGLSLWPSQAWRCHGIPQVLTGITGYINDYRGVAPKPNAVLVGVPASAAPDELIAATFSASGADRLEWLLARTSCGPQEPAHGWGDWTVSARLLVQLSKDRLGVLNLISFNLFFNLI